MTESPVITSGESLAEVVGGVVVSRGAGGAPQRAVIDSREVREGDLFVGLPGSRVDGGSFAAEVLESGAWGALVSSEWARRQDPGSGWLIGVDDPLRALQDLARQRRRDLGCRVIGITGSNGKTSVKDICRALFGAGAFASRENRNTEIGLPLTILEAPQDTAFLICEMGMRGEGQIAELCEIAEPDVGVITNVGPVHLELLGSMEAIASAKAEILAGIRPGGTAVVPADPGEYLAPHIEGEIEPSPGDRVAVLRFGDSGEVFASGVEVSDEGISAEVNAPAGSRRFEFPFRERHNLSNALAAISAGIASGISLEEMARRAPGIVFSRLRGELVRLEGGSVLINDCYNANPVSMRAALDHLSTFSSERQIAVLGEMGEIGSEAAEFHARTGIHARDVGVDLLIGVGPLARSYEPDEWFETASEAAARLIEIIGGDDTILVKGSRSVGLEEIAETLDLEAGSA